MSLLGKSGIGLYASKLLSAVSPESRIFLVARNSEKANFTKEQVHSIPGYHPLSENIIPMTCDHTSFESVRKFCTELRLKLLETKTKENTSEGIDVLCLNAAILLGEDSKAVFTQDDFEITFQTNHLAPFLISNLLFDLINPGGRVVVTSSGLHAFSSFGEFAGINDKFQSSKKRFEMVNGQEFDHKQSYAASKLCNVAFCLGLNRRLSKKNARAVCFTPGLIPESGLFRHQKNWLQTVMMKEAVGMDDTVEWGGSMLAWMALSDRAILEDNNTGMAYWRAPLGISKRGGKITKDVYLAPVNEEATIHTNQDILWKISAELAGVSFERHIE